jgi:hypothetical protein
MMVHSYWLYPLPIVSTSRSLVKMESCCYQPALLTTLLGRIPY